MLTDVYKETETRMKNAISALQNEFNAIRTGRANPALVEMLPVEYYGISTPLRELASISVPEARALLIRPFDPGTLKDIERAILKSDLGLTPNTNGDNIHLNLPVLTEERRRELVRVVHAKSEESRVVLRNIRRESIRDLRSFEEEHWITEDELHQGKEKVQEITDHFSDEIDAVCERKEKEVMEV
ncbi:MAG: ribosome recycling factor [Chloroflexota bacterium]|nr:ribosome recycling factor [Chloroflexota bacterium]